MKKILLLLVATTVLMTAVFAATAPDNDPAIGVWMTGGLVDKGTGRRVFLQIRVYLLNVIIHPSIHPVIHVSLL